MDWENWMMCAGHYKLTHFDHSDRDHYLGHWSIRQDLAMNFCKSKLGRDNWAE